MKVFRKRFRVENLRNYKVIMLKLDSKGLS